MQLDQILEYISNPDKLLAIGDLEGMIDWTTHWINTLELELADDDFELSKIRKELIEKHDKVNKADAELKLTEEYRETRKKEITLNTIKAYRANIRKKRDRLISNFR